MLYRKKNPHGGDLYGGGVRHRIAVKTHEENEKLAGALGSIMRGDSRQK